MATEKDLINGNSRKRKNEYLDGLKDAKEIKPKNPGDVPAIPPLSNIEICKCSHQCHKLTSEDKQTLFNLFHKKTHDEQSEYINYCMKLVQPKRKKIDKAVSQRQITFIYELQIGPKIVAVCQRTLCSVLGVTPRRMKFLQNKIKSANQEIDCDTRSKLNDNEFLEATDDPVNDQLIIQNNFSMIKVREETVRDSLEADGQLGRIKAEMRTEVMKLLDGSSKSSRVKRPKSPHEMLLLNELIREYFDWIGYKYTSNVFIAECELGKHPLDRSFLTLNLGVKETEKSKSLPLLFCLIEAFKELKASSMSSC